MNFIWKSIRLDEPAQEISKNNTKQATETGLPHIVLAHGFGANEQDLASLVHEIAVPGVYHFPRAPVVLQPGSYAWFPSKPAELLKVFQGEYFSALEDLEVPELGRIARDVAEDIGRIIGPDDKLLLGGFSQGSMLALRVLLETRMKIRGLILLSSSLVDRAASAALINGSPKVPVYQSHGSQDQILPISGARALQSLLDRAGWPVQFCEFEGAHGIPSLVIRELADFIRAALH